MAEIKQKLAKKTCPKDRDRYFNKTDFITIRKNILKAVHFVIKLITAELCAKNDRNVLRSNLPGHKSF